MCLKPETAVSGGFVTSFIDVCHCKSIRNEDADDSARVKLCGKCHKTISDGQRQGSLTQWIFRFDSCKCDQPIVVERSIEQTISKGQQPAQGQDVNSVASVEEDAELPVPSEQFPIERYRPIAILGHGASGTVYLAKDRLLNKKVGVKVLNHLDGEQLIAFQNEAKLTSKLEHPNIIQVLDFGPTPSGFPYMVLEYSDRVLSLAMSLRENGPLDVRIAIEVFSKVAEALEFANAMGVFHRDLKPSNILFTYAETSDINVKLIDFGVAFLRKESLEPTRTDMTTVVGTVGYMAPELADDHKYDVRCEIYSLGCVLFEALTGRLPFVAESPLEMLALHTNQIAQPLSAVAGVSFPIQMERLVADCLAKDPEARPASASVFKNRLQRCLISMDASAPSSKMTPAEPIDQEPLRSNKLTSKTVAVIAMSVLVLIGLAGLGLNAGLNKGKTVQAKPSPPAAVAEPRKLADQIYGNEITVDKQDITSLSVPFNAEEITGVRITRCRIKDPSTLSNLAFFPRLKNLSIEETSGLSKSAMTSLTDGLKKIASGKTAYEAKNRLEKPLFMNFSKSDIDNSGLVLLQKIPSVAALSLAGTALDDTAVDWITPHKMLQAVDLSGTAITDEAVEKLTKMKPLLLLRVHNCANLKKFAASTVIDHTSIVVEQSQTDIDDEFPIYFQAAQQNNVIAQTNLASLYYGGKGVDRNFDEAFKWYKKAALAGAPSSAGAQLTVGTFYKLGLIGGKKPDGREALKWYHMGEANGSKLKAARLMAPLYEELGQTNPADRQLALKYYKIVADTDNIEAQSKLAELYAAGYFGKVDYPESFKWLQKAAKHGDGYALYSVGFCYLAGQGVKQDDSMALKYFTRSAEAGDDVGMYNLGYMYMNGKGTKVDLKKALEWFRKSSDIGHPEASTSVGFFYDKGIGVERDYAVAMKYYKRAGENANALLALGDLYRDGKGVTQNAAVANSYYRRSAALGSDRAKARLGL